MVSGAAPTLVMPQCKLCLNHVVKLERSHFISSGIYKRLRDDHEKNPNPYHITLMGAVQTSKQLTAPLLCWNCEQRFNKLGEDWVLRHCLQKDGQFPLASILSARPADVSSSHTPTRLYYASSIPGIDVSALAYFGASIFWRGSIHPWNTDGAIPIKLGPFQEPLRRYLTGEQPFPQECALWATVREGKEIDRLTYPPAGRRVGKFHSHRFPMPGLVFILMVGKNIPPNYRDKCIVNGPGNPIMITSIIEPMLLDEARKMLHRVRAK